MVAQAYRYASATLRSLLCQQIIYMTVWGWLIFVWVPGPLVIGGAAIVVLSRLYLLRPQMHAR